MSEKFLKTGDVAKIFDVTLRTIKNWRQSGKLKPISINEKGHFLYSESQIEEFKLLLASGKSESVQPDKTTEASVHAKTKSPNTPKPNENKKTQANKKSQSVEKKSFIKDEKKKYGNLLQGKPTNALATSSSKTFKSNLLGDAEIISDEVQILIQEFSKVKLNVQTLKVLDACILKLTQNFPHGEDITDSALINHKKITISSEEYMKMTGLKDSQKAYAQLKDAMETLYRISFKWDQEGYAGRKRKKLHYEMHLAEALKSEEISRNRQTHPLQKPEYIFEKGTVTLSFSLEMARFFATAYVMAYPYGLLTVNSHKNPHSFFIGRKLALHHNMNIAKKNSNRISVKTLITALPNLPKYEDIMKNGNRTITQQIIQPFERDLIALKEVYGILKDWHYCNSSGEAITDDQVEKYNYATWIECLVEFDFADYPDQSERITKIKLEKQRALIQSKSKKL